MFGLETYSPYSDKDLSDFRIFDGGELDLPFGAPQPVLEIIEKYVDELLQNNKLPVMIGGEHTVTIGAIRAAARRFHELNLVHFDAHADLRDDYCGEKFSHACVIRRCFDILGGDKIFQFGIRSGERDEFTFAKKHLFIQMFNLDQIGKIVRDLQNKPVYLTIDLDVLDTSVFPATGTPEPGGVSFGDLLSAINEVSKLNVIGADLCEYSPPYDADGASAAVACKVLRELLLSVSK
jgi:agmatinase